MEILPEREHQACKDCRSMEAFTDMEAAKQRAHRPPMGEPVLTRGFRILSAFTAGEPELTLTQLSDRAELPLSTTLRLVQQLMRLGAVERFPDGRIGIGIRLLEYAALAPRGHGLRAVALPYMEDLHRATGQHVQLAVREGDEGVIVERLSATHASEVLYYAGGRIPLHGTGLGLVLLAHARRDFQESYLAKDHKLEPENTLIDSAGLRSQLELVRSTGVAHFSRVFPTPVDTVAAPVVDRTGRCVAAISVLGASGSSEIRTAVPAVIAIARAISRGLGRSS
jgi:DNA-binding IclR family transcriptional regulator